MRTLITVLAALVVVGCGESTPTGPGVLQLYQMVCVDSTVTHPAYRCDGVHVDTVTIILNIPNPNPVP